MEQCCTVQCKNKPGFKTSRRRVSIMCKGIFIPPLWPHHPKSLVPSELRPGTCSSLVSRTWRTGKYITIQQLRRMRRSITFQNKSLTFKTFRCNGIIFFLHCIIKQFKGGTNDYINNRFICWLFFWLINELEEINEFCPLFFFPRNWKFGLTENSSNYRLLFEYSFTVILKNKYNKLMSDSSCHKINVHKKYVQIYAISLEVSLVSPWAL